MKNDYITFFIVVFILVALLICLINSIWREDTPTWEVAEYHVSQGDTLWSISKQYCPDTVDKREWVHKVVKLNDIENSGIYPGETIKVLEVAK